MATSAANGQEFIYLPNGPQATMSICCGGTVTYSYYSTDWQDLEDDAGGGSVATYVWGLENQSELVERDDPSGNRLYAQHDANMDVTALVNTSGSVVERFSYTPNGIATVLTPSWTSTTDSYNWIFRWQGGKYNATNGLYTFGYRDYSPTLGTWLEEDPSGYAAGPNVYQAMLGAPIEKTDPYGLQAATTQPGATGSGVSGSAGQGLPPNVLGPPAPPPGIWVTDPPDIQPPTIQPPKPRGPMGPPAPPMAERNPPYPKGTIVTPGGAGPTEIAFPDGSKIYIWNDPLGIDTPTILRLGPDGGTLAELPGDKPTVQPQVLNLPPYQPTSTPPKNPIIIRIPLPFLGNGGWQIVYNPLKPGQIQATGSLGPGTDVTITGKVGNAPTGVESGGVRHGR